MGEKRRFRQAASFGLPDDCGWKRSYLGLPNTLAEADGAPVHAFGRLFMYSGSPGCQTGVVLHQGNSSPKRLVNYEFEGGEA